MDQISFILTDSGDGVLLPGPGYAAFASNFGVYGSTVVRVVPTHLRSRYVPTRKDLDRAYQQSKQHGHPPKKFIICQPNNPTGTIYSKRDMKLMTEWALNKGLHVVSDEIYALSTFPGYYITTGAADVIQELNNQTNNDDLYLGDNVNIVADLSKDWV